MASSTIAPAWGSQQQASYAQGAGQAGYSGTPAAPDTGLLSDTVSLSPLSPIDPAYEKQVASSQTTPGAYSREMYARGLSQEPLVPINDYGIDGTSYYAIADGTNAPYGKALAGAQPTIYVRATVARRLQEVNALLRPYGYELYVRDGWRSPTTQHAIFVTFEQNYKKQHPNASDAEVRAHALKYASDPVFSKNDPTTVPLHATGGAVDVTLSRIGTHTPIDLGTPFDDTTPRAHSAYFETHAPSNQEEAYDKQARELLNAAMLKVGFTNYPNEWWHFDLGDRMYGRFLDFLRTKAPADVPAYGYTQPAQASLAPNVLQTSVAAPAA